MSGGYSPDLFFQTSTIWYPDAHNESGITFFHYTLYANFYTLVVNGISTVTLLQQVNLDLVHLRQKTSRTGQMLPDNKQSSPFLNKTSKVP